MQQAVFVPTKSHYTAPIDLAAAVALVARFVIAAAFVIAAVKVTTSLATFLLGWTLVSIAAALVLTTFLGGAVDDTDVA